jgi:hypothetical protein
MSSLFSLTWRLLLAAALVLNPVAGASMAMAATVDAHGKVQATTAKAEMPPCHEMVMAGQAMQAPTKAPAPGKHGSDCGNLACQFGGCCVVVVLDVPAIAVPEMDSGRQSPVAHAMNAAKAPPPLRMIRPPIA